LVLSAEFSELLLLVLLHSLFFKIGFVFLGEFRLSYHDVAVDLSALLNLVLVKVMYQKVHHGSVIHHA
jgi:hypothetical protein